jgi:hypothetical protein
VLAIKLGGIGVDPIDDMAVDAAGNIFLAGTFDTPADFDPGTGTTTLTSLGGTDVFVVKFSSTGGFLWVARIGGAQAEQVTGLATDAAGNVYLSGGFQGTTDFDPGAGTLALTSLGGEDGFVTKLSASGSLVWARRFGGVNADRIQGVAADAAGRAFATGVFSGSANPSPAAGPTLISNGAAQDGFLLGIDATGTINFGSRIGGTESDAATAVAVTSGGSVVVGGSFRGSALFGSGVLQNQLTAAGGGDAFIASYDAAGQLLWTRALGAAGEEEIRSGGLVADLADGVVATGTFTGTTDLDAGVTTATRTSLGGSDWFAVRYDAAGLYQSSFTVGSIGAEAAPRPAVDPAGALLVTGSFAGALDFDPGAGTSIIASLAGGGATDVYAARYSLAGDLLWVSRFGEGTSLSERQNLGTAIAFTPAGGILVTGRFFGSPDFDPGNPVFRLTSLGSADGFVVMLTTSGALALTP